VPLIKETPHLTTKKEHRRAQDLQMTFIHIEDPTSKPTKVQRRQAHSHAARVSHAKAARRRTTNHNYASTVNGKDADETLYQQEQQRPKNASALHQEHELISKRPIVPSGPGIQFDPLEHDSLVIFIKSLEPQEQFIFHHCTYRYRRNVLESLGHLRLTTQILRLSFRICRFIVLW
jgi:hypothetical protein